MTTAVPVSEQAPFGEKTVWMQRIRGDSGNGYQNGVGFIYAPDGTFAAQFGGEPFEHRERFEFPAGSRFTVRVMNHGADGVLLDETFTCEVTGSRDEVGSAQLGPGVEMVPSGRQGRLRKEGFYFGVSFKGARAAPGPANNI